MVKELRKYICIVGMLPILLGSLFESHIWQIVAESQNSSPMLLLCEANWGVLVDAGTGLCMAGPAPGQQLSFGGTQCDL